MSATGFCNGPRIDAASMERGFAPEEPLRGSLVVLEVEAAPDHLRGVYEVLDAAAHRCDATETICVADIKQGQKHGARSKVKSARMERLRRS